MGEVVYPSIDQAIQAHDQVIAISGGAAGILHQGQLESVLHHIQNDEYYPTFASKLTHLCHSVCQFHCFVDGNKRTAIALTVQMLEWNACDYCVPAFIRNMENVVVALAEGHVSKPLLERIIASHLEQTFDDDENLKLAILDALLRPS